MSIQLDYFEVLCTLKRRCVIGKLEKECAAIAYLMTVCYDNGGYKSCFESLNSLARFGDVNYLVWYINKEILRKNSEIGEKRYKDDIDESLYLNYETGIQYNIVEILESSIPSWFYKSYTDCVELEYIKCTKPKVLSTGDKELDKLLMYIYSVDRV